MKLKGYISSFIVVIGFVFSFKNVTAQKKLVVNDSFKFWPMMREYGISNNGKFIWYTYQLSHSLDVAIKGVGENFEKIGKTVMGTPKFTANSKYVIYLTNDTLNVVNLINLVNISHKRIPNIISFSIPEEGTGRWLTYQSGPDSYLLDLESGKLHKYPGRKGAVFNATGTAMVIKGENFLEYVKVPYLDNKTIFQGSHTGDVIFDNQGEGIAFCPYINGFKTLCYYKPGMLNAKVLVGKDKGLDTDKKISFRTPKFTQDSKRILFGLIIRKSDSVRKQEIEHLNIWHYQEAYIQSVLAELKKTKEAECMAVIGVNENNIVLLERPDSTKIAGGGSPNNYYVITETIGNSSEQTWNNFKKTYQLVSLKDGSMKSVACDAPIFSKPPKLSPGETFLSWYDFKRSSYRTYEIGTGMVRDVTSNFQVSLSNNNVYDYADKIASSHLNFWLADDKAMIVSDKYDLWQIDPYGKKAAINVTGSIGKKNKVAFRLAENEGGLLPYQSKDTIVLAYLDETTKENGLCKVTLGKENQPDINHRIAGLYYFPGFYEGPKIPKKAKYSNWYVLEQMSTTSAPSVCVTNDFKNYKFFSDIQPQKEYNWMTSELIKWNIADGIELHGILYKPENFDSSKKYPVIFHYYERSSHQLNQYRIPELSPGALDIPWYTSNGYLVFIPDMYTPGGNPAKGVIDGIESAVVKLKEFPWVDQTKMGLQGHSYGGWETFVLATNTNHFAAAQPSAGLTDFVSGYSSLYGERGWMYETGQNNMRALPWERPDLYIQNSPIYKAGNVTAPMLIMHNKGDSGVDFTQSRAMYVALRRQKKPVWMLDYDGEGHTLTEEKNQLDFAIRQQQFFGHYLKGEPMPMWMKEPGNLSLDLDTAKKTN